MFTTANRDPLMPGERVAWAIERSGLKLEDLAERIGCTHATLSQWSTGKTTMAHAKAGLLLAFADATGVNLRWLLSGEGPALDRYGEVAQHPLVVRAHEIAASHSGLAEVAERLLNALDAPAPVSPGDPAEKAT
jgi:transcriptional regulator with XRE-family HTH domain